MTSAIEISDLNVSYGDVVALADTSLAVRQGHVTALIGMNGSGKSTLFKAILGVVRPLSGDIRVLGETPERARRRGLVAYSPQSESVDWSFPVSVWDVVMMGRYCLQPSPTRRPRVVDRQAVADALERVGLSELAQRQIGQLSGGQRKRAFIARSIAQEAQVLLLDEPFAGVDRGSEDMIIGLLRELAATGVTVFLSTHELEALQRFAQSAVLLRNRTVFSGPINEALEPQQLSKVFGIDVMGGGDSA